MQLPPLLSKPGGPVWLPLSSRELGLGWEEGGRFPAGLPGRLNLLPPPRASLRTPLPPGRRLMAADPGQPEGNKHSSVSFSSFRELLPSFGQQALAPPQECPSSTGRWPPVASAQPPPPTSQRTKLKRGGTGRKAMCPEQLGLSGTPFTGLYSVGNAWESPERCWTYVWSGR